MKKLFILSPFVIWIADYFIWKHAAIIGAFGATPGITGVWWSMTSIAGGLAELISIPFAVMNFIDLYNE